jgi:hypothetical protein
MAKTKDAALEIHSDLVMKGELSMVKDVILTGKFEGQLTTDGCLTVSPGGVATGTIEAGALVLQPGNLVEARVRIAPPKPPAAAGKPPRSDKAEAKPGAASGAKWPSLRKLKEFALGR